MFVRPIRAGERGTGFIARCHLEGASDGEGSSWRRGRRRRGDETPSRRAKPPGWRPRKWCVAFPVNPPETRARTARHIRSEPNDENTSPLASLTRALFPASPSTQNAELFTLTYGAIVRQVLHDYEDCVEDVNKKLDSMGFDIGCRLVEDFLAKTSTTRCGDFKETAEVVAKVGLRLFLGIGTRVGEWNPEGTECVITLDTNPLADFVELPERYRDLSYSQMLCGVIRGALEMVSVRVTCEWARDALRGGDGYALRLRFVEYITHEMPEFDD